jgi:hypothetical protein
MYRVVRTPHSTSVKPDSSHISQSVKWFNDHVEGVPEFVGRTTRGGRGELGESSQITAVKFLLLSVTAACGSDPGLESGLPSRQDQFASIRLKLRNKLAKISTQKVSPSSIGRSRHQKESCDAWLTMELRY